ncbi:MAG: cytidylate kinase-like family protein [Oscillospiraceae bacterium]|nr:cytidylate kinase-like family protein [Oscillospiraceae bacterium]
MKHTIITISRQYGSGGRRIGQVLADRLNIPCYDKSILDKSAKISELSPNFIEKNEQHLSNSFLFDITTTASIYKAQSAVIREFAEKGRCVIVGRCADRILERDFPCLKVFLYAGFDERCRRAVAEYGKEEKDVQDLVKKVDRGRERFFRLFHEGDWKDATNYDLCLNTERFGMRRTVDIIEQAYHMASEEEPV